MPLPKPRANERRSEFISRCVINPEIQADFGTNEQRVAVCYSLYDQKTIIKKAKESWKGNFDKLLASSERKEFAGVRKYYEGQYSEAIANFLKTGKSNGFDNLFRSADLSEIYRQIYVNIGLKFAKWYSKNFDKVISKQTDVSGYDDIWAERFARVSQQIAAERVVLVQGTAKATLISIFKRLSSDPEFMAMGEVEAGRILRQKFGQYSKSQAERLVRTEATNAANYATLESATDMFGQENLQKEWMTSVDGRERPAHRAADAQIVDFKERFLVGGELLFHPGDPAGSAKNVVRCRCSVAPFPKEDAQAAGTIEGFGVRPPGGSTQSVLRTPKPVREAVEVVDDFKDVKTVKEAKDLATKIFSKSDINIQSVTISRTISIDTLNQYLKQINKLTNKYNVKTPGNVNTPVKLIFKSSKRMYGFVERRYFSGPANKLHRINFGDRTDSAETRSRNLNYDKFKKTFKSPVDPENNVISTVTHEFAHIISDRRNVIDAEFYKELEAIRKQYFEDIDKYLDTGNVKAFSETYMGSYASTNLDEFLAECFTEYELKSNPSKYARLVGELVNKYFKK